jgi:arylsulfatase A-like enzyme
MARAATLYLISTLAIGCGTAPPPPGADDSGFTPPNIFLISLDALRADHLGSYGYERETSPFLDRVAAEGTRFANAFVNTHGTPPSHTTMLTSLYQQSHGVSLDSAEPGATDSIPANALMVQEILRGRGYLTISVTGGGYLSRGLGFDRGFVFFENAPKRFAGQVSRVLQLLQQHAVAERPVFVFLHTYEIHSPYEAPERYRGRFGSFESSFEPTSENLLRVVNTARRDLAPTDLEHVMARYDEGIRYADDCLRELFVRLSKRGFLDNALVIITADHGEEFAEHGGMLHRGTLYDELLRVPMVLWGRVAEPGSVIERPVSCVDIAPTILAATGVEIPPQMQGSDLLRPRREDVQEEAVFSQYGRVLYSIRTAEWKLIQRTRKGTVELYDLEADPGEQKNLADREPNRAAAMLDRLTSWRESLPQAGEAALPAQLTDREREQLEALGYVD